MFLCNPAIDLETKQNAPCLLHQWICSVLIVLSFLIKFNNLVKIKQNLNKTHTVFASLCLLFPNWSTIKCSFISLNWIWNNLCLWIQIGSILIPFCKFLGKFCAWGKLNLCCVSALLRCHQALTKLLRCHHALTKFVKKSRPGNPVDEALFVDLPT